METSTRHKITPRPRPVPNQPQIILNKMEVNKQNTNKSNNNQAVVKTSCNPPAKGKVQPVKPSHTLPVKNACATRNPANPASSPSVKQPSSRLSQRSLFTKQPKGLTKEEQEQLDHRFGELSDSVLKMIRTSSPFTKQSLETLLSHQLTQCLGPLGVHPSVTPVFIRATRDLLVSLVREYEHSEVSPYLVPEDSPSEGTFLESESTKSLSYRDHYLKQLVVSVLQGLCGHKLEECRNMQILSEASKEKIRDIRRLIKADPGISPETLEQLEQQLDDLRKTLSFKHLETQGSQGMHITELVPQALRVSCVRDTCTSEASSAEICRQTSSVCLINHTVLVKEKDKVFLERKESKMIDLIHALENVQEENLDCANSCSDRISSRSGSENNACNVRSGYGDLDDEITQEETKMYLEALIADKRQKISVRNVRALEVISEEEEIVIETAASNLEISEENVKSERHSTHNKVDNSQFDADRAVEKNSLRKVKSNFESLNRKSELKEVQEESCRSLTRNASILNLTTMAQLEREMETPFLSNPPIERLSKLNQSTRESHNLDDVQKVDSNLGLLDSFVSDISKEIQLVHRQVHVSPSSTFNMFDFRENTQIKLKEQESLSSDKWSGKRVELSVIELTRVLSKISKRVKELPSYLDDFVVDSHQRELLFSLFKPYSSYLPNNSNTMNTAFIEKVSTIYFRLAEILDRTPLKVKSQPISVLNPPQTFINILASMATTEFFKDCFISSIIEMNEEELEKVTFYDRLSEQFNVIRSCSQETMIHKPVKIKHDFRSMQSLADVEKSKQTPAENINTSILPDVTSSLALRYAIHRNVTMRDDPEDNLANNNIFLELSPDLLTLQNVSDMFQFFSSVLNDVPSRIKSRGILTLNPPSSLLHALNILYSADSPCSPYELKETNSFASLTLQDAANFFLILSKTLQNTPSRLRSSPISDLNPPVSLLKAVSLLTSLAHRSVLNTESQEEVESQASQDLFFDAMEDIELLECDAS